ncbi:expressed unknown protein [Seminavis robusta]|uniref:Uncharacterized protein n=1 Tax=Seminavis robusta TaxID=568900 RepID=A0A9N8F1I9_9STRA|nr:expressed unknown protein [Seminavis robusta]|eukprot:Sro2286_g322010.1 n/a (432) ;mRNA; r:11563-12979
MKGIVAFLLSFWIAVIPVVRCVDEVVDCPSHDYFYVSPMHHDTACDLAGQNQYKKSLDRRAIWQRLHESGTQNVPTQRTSFCPETVQPLMDSDKFQEGFNTAWIVENTATVPVVVAFVMERPDGTRIEVSAMNHKIAPPNHDPKAILKPGEWKAVQTYEGHVFHVRELLQDGSQGMVLLQHRVGMIPITNKYGHELHCNPSEPDEEPVVVQQDAGAVRDPDFARKAPPASQPCNIVDVGFRNHVGCPVNGYYTGHFLTRGLVEPRGNVTKWKESLARKPKSCHEVFQFHLGLEEHPNDFQWDWASTSKYESAYIGNNFVFRLAKDERIVVDSYSVTTTKVVDCPTLKKQVNNAVSVPYGEAISTGERSFLRNWVKTFYNGTDPFAETMNASEWIVSVSRVPFILPAPNAIGRQNAFAQSDLQYCMQTNKDP